MNYSFAGSYENQVRLWESLRTIVPAAIVIVLILLYLQFRSIGTTIVVANWGVPVRSR